MPQLPISDEYFNRSAAVVAGTPVHNTRVRYCVFAHEGGVICGINRAAAFLKEHCIGPLTVRALRDGGRFGPGEAVMVVEGLFGELVNLETTYLGMLAFSGPATHMDEIVRAAAGVPIIDMAARHYPYEIIQQTAYAAAIGGAAGTSTRAGHRYVVQWLGTGEADTIRVGNGKTFEFRLYGSIPHALNAVYEGNSIESAKAYHAKFPQVPLTVLIDFEGRELDVCREAVREFGDAFFAVRLDTHGGRVHQGGHDTPVAELVDRIVAGAPDREAASAALDRYGFGAGVTIESAYNVRRTLDEAGAERTKIIVSGGFNAGKVTAFRAAGAPMDAIGTGSWVDFLMFTSDITDVWEDGRWFERSKVGRGRRITVPPLEICISR